MFKVGQRVRYVTGKSRYVIVEAHGLQDHQKLLVRDIVTGGVRGAECGQVRLDGRKKSAWK